MTRMHSNAFQYALKTFIRRKKEIAHTFSPKRLHRSSGIYVCFDFFEKVWFRVNGTEQQLL